MRNRQTDVLKFILLVVLDALSVIFAAAVAYYISVPPDEMKISFELIIWITGNVIAVLVFFSIFGMYSLILSNVSIIEALKLAFGLLCVAFLNVLYLWIRRFIDPSLNKPINMGTITTFAIITFFLTGFIRFFGRIISLSKYFAKNLTTPKKRVMLVGAGSAGAALINEMHHSTKISYNPVCLIDDSVEKIGKSVCGVKVVGSTYEIRKYAQRYNVEEIFVTMPTCDKKRLNKIISRCREAGRPVKILPGTYQLVEGEVSVSSMRDVDIQDLLGREQVKVDVNEIMGYIVNKVVLVTGGGGSIGSELCRQIATHHPKQLIILDIYENNAYDIEQELKRNHRELNLLTLIASIRDAGKIKDVFEKYRPQIVFHAAAHKHVPLMETSPNEAIKNNVFGTFNVARYADIYGAETFVQISTDKAVNPTNVMGASKRICEMIVQTIGKHSLNTKFVAVRFGNVLGSNGSVIPLFKKQIKEGGPVTVTHKDIIRYFMTIPEAVSLVLQAGAYAKGGQIFVLDMGEPVRIYDLAYNLIKLSGLEPGVDIDIVCTGLRPGEKLYEERLMDEEGMQKTPNGLINIAQPIKLDEENFWKNMEDLYAAAYEETDKMKYLVKKLVPTYKIDERKDSNCNEK